MFGVSQKIIKKILCYDMFQVVRYAVTYLGASHPNGEEFKNIRGSEKKSMILIKKVCNRSAVI